ncbi:MAG: hypothetical protein JRN33_07915 [Nitrososphaerota archaeon]|jgi:hypothetical protein|nr:hypothetical protein [Nitrososphaerota archaeon]
MVKRPIGVLKRIFHRRSRRWRPYLAGLVLLAALVPFTYAFEVSTPTIFIQTTQLKTGTTHGYTLTNQTGTYNVPESFSVAFTIVMNFTARGAISVNNPVDVGVAIFGVNTSEALFLKNFGAVGFTDARNGGIYGRTGDFNLTAATARLTLSNGSSIFGGTVYIGHATLYWFQAGPTWVYLAPPVKAFVGVPNSGIQIGDPAITISDVSDTLAVNSNDSVLRLTWILVGFSVLMLQPILEAILLQDEAQRSHGGEAQSIQEVPHRVK